jgi:hypothetical protein
LFGGGFVDMVKAKSKKGPQQRDFKKIKVTGYGKNRKVRPRNFVNTTLRTRALVVPYQKVADEERLRSHRLEQTTRRNQSADELCAKLSHHNAKTRREALRGLRELCETDPTVFHMRLGRVLTGVLEGLQLAGEEEKTDTALCELLAAFFSFIPEQQLAPHGPLVWAYLSSSLSHLRPQVRLLGLLVLEAILDRCPRMLMLVVDQQSLLDKLHAALVNRYQQVKLNSLGLKMKRQLWVIVLKFLKLRSQMLQEAEGGSDQAASGRFFPHFQAYVGRTAQFNASTKGSLKLLLEPLAEDLLECIPSDTDATAAALLLQCLSFVTADPDVLNKEHTLLQKLFRHIAGNFPIGAMSTATDFLIPNCWASCVLLGCGASEGMRELVQFCCDRIEDSELDPEMRRLVLRTCERVWEREGFGGHGGRGLALAKSFAALFASRIPEAVRTDCVSCLNYLFASYSVPSEILESLLRWSVRVLWKAPGSSECVVGILNALWSYVRRHSRKPLCCELLCSLLVPVLSVELEDRIAWGSFGVLHPREQVRVVRLFSLLSCPAPDELQAAWKRLLLSKDTSVEAGRELVTSLRVCHAVAFAHLSDFWAFLVDVMTATNDFRFSREVIGCLRDTAPSERMMMQVFKGTNIEAMLTK